MPIKNDAKPEVATTSVPQRPGDWTIALELTFLAVLFILALATPIVVYCCYNVVVGILLGIGIPIAWMCLLPNSCMNGGLLFAMLAMGQFVAGCGWIVVGLARGVASLF